MLFDSVERFLLALIFSSIAKKAEDFLFDLVDSILVMVNQEIDTPNFEVKLLGKRLETHNTNRYQSRIVNESIYLNVKPTEAVTRPGCRMS